MIKKYFQLSIILALFSISFSCQKSDKLSEKDLPKLLEETIFKDNLGNTIITQKFLVKRFPTIQTQIIEKFVPSSNDKFEKSGDDGPCLRVQYVRQTTSIGKTVTSVEYYAEVHTCGQISRFVARYSITRAEYCRLAGC